MKALVTAILTLTLAGVGFAQDDSKIGGVSGAYRVGGGVSVPVPTVKVEPSFSEEACRARYQGAVTLQVVISAEGTPTDIRVVKKLGLGLDEKAIEAMQKWRFKPGLKDGVPVPVIATVVMTFHLPDATGSCAETVKANQ